MTRKKLVMAVGLLVLGVAGFFSTNAHKNYITNVTTAWFRTFGGTFLTLFHASAVCTHLATVGDPSAIGFACISVVQGGVVTTYQLYITNNTAANKKLYFK